MKHFICELILSCVIASPGAKPIDELTYGNVLYSYYQQDYPEALLTAMVAEAQGRTGDDPARFKLAEGSFAFSDGMYELARETFQKVDPAELTELDRMRLAFHLAREYHRRGDYADMSAELAKIDLKSGWLGRRQYHPEVEFMRAEGAMASGDLAGAEATLAHVDDGDPLLAYGLFNLGIAYRDAGDLDGSRRVFERLAGTRIVTGGKHPTPAETMDLVQRAKLALSFVAREQHDTADAAGVLGGLPGDGRYRDAALASYGGLAMDNEDYELAARIWLTLQNQTYWTSSTAQARLAFPMSLEKLASREMALAQYRAAEQSFEARLALLTDLSARARDPAWVKSLLLVFSAPEQDDERMAELVERWGAQLGHTDWLEWLATEDTHQVLMEWRELLAMRDWLTLLPGEIAAFQEVSNERRRRSAEARHLLDDESLIASRDALRATVDAQAAVLESLKRETPTPEMGWMGKLASPDEMKLLEDLAGMRALVSTNMKGAEQKKWLGRIARLEGTVFWQIVDTGPARVRELEKAERDNIALLADVDARITRVRNAEREFAAGVETDFLAFTDRADVLTADVGRALNEREVALAGEIRRGMAREMQEVQQYLLVTRIGIARATDALAMESQTVEGE
jgi:tetratricopeptide (TPR) repeat protein